MGAKKWDSREPRNKVLQIVDTVLEHLQGMGRTLPPRSRNDAEEKEVATSSGSEKKKAKRGKVTKKAKIERREHATRGSRSRDEGQIG